LIVFPEHTDILCQVQQVCGSANDTLECSDGLHYHSKIIETRASTWERWSLWLVDFTRGCQDPGK